MTFLVLFSYLCDNIYDIKYLFFHATNSYLKIITKSHQVHKITVIQSPYIPTFFALTYYTVPTTNYIIYFTSVLPKFIFLSFLSHITHFFHHTHFFVINHHHYSAVQQHLFLVLFFLSPLLFAYISLLFLFLSCFHNLKGQFPLPFHISVKIFFPIIFLFFVTTLNLSINFISSLLHLCLK